MGKAILHIHSTFSDGTCSVAELLEEVEQRSDVNVIGITDHDDCRSFQAAQEWKWSRPGSRLAAIWGTEITAFGFTHVLGYKMHPPFPTVLPKKFSPLREVVEQLHAMGCYAVIPHVDAPVVGLTRRRMKRVVSKLPFFGYELITPYFTGARSLPRLRAMGEQHGLLALGGSDAHFPEDLYRVILTFPGSTAEDFEQSWIERTVVPHLGQEGPKKTFARHMRQQRRALVEQPAEQMRSWVRGRINATIEYGKGGRWRLPEVVGDAYQMLALDPRLFEMMGNDVDDFALALHTAMDDQEGLSEEEPPLLVK